MSERRNLERSDRLRAHKRETARLDLLGAHVSVLGTPGQPQWAGRLRTCVGYVSTYMYLHTHTCNICIRACFPPMDLPLEQPERGTRRGQWCCLRLHERCGSCPSGSACSHLCLRAVSVRVSSCAHWKKCSAPLLAGPGVTAQQQPLLCWAAGFGSPQHGGIPGTRVSAEGQDEASTWGNSLRVLCSRTAFTQARGAVLPPNACTGRRTRELGDGCDEGVQDDKSGQFELQNRTDGRQDHALANTTLRACGLR